MRTRALGYLVGRGRDDTTRQFPLLSCSAALVALPAGGRAVLMDDLGSVIAGLKKAAKDSPDHLAIQTLE